MAGEVLRLPAEEESEQKLCRTPRNIDTKSRVGETSTKPNLLCNLNLNKPLKNLNVISLMPDQALISKYLHRLDFSP